MKRLTTRWKPLALAAACAVLSAPLFAAEIPGNLGYGLDKLVEDSLTLKANPQAPTPFGGYTTEAAASYAADAIMDDATGRVLVDITLTGELNADAMKARLESRIPSLTIQAMDADYRHTGIIEGFVSVDDVSALANSKGVRSVFLALMPEHGALQPQPSAVPGDVLNKLGTAFDQGVTQHRVDRINQYYNPNAIVNYDGAGTSVAVISDSFGSRFVSGAPATPTVATDMANFDLPGGAANPLNTTPVYVYRDEPAGSGTDEGRGMAQIVYKMAPRAKLAFFSGAFGEVQFANDIRALAAGVTGGPSGTFKADVMVDDLSYGGEPFFGETIIGNAIDDATALGVSYFSSAGNNIGINAYESPLRIVPNGIGMTAATNSALVGTNIDLTGVPAGLYAGGFHNFNPNGQLDVAQLVNMPSGSPGATEMQWDDPYDQRPLQPATPPVLTANGTIGVGGSVTYDDTSTPALPVFTMGTRYVITETATSGNLDGRIRVLDAANTVLLDQDTVVDEIVYFDPPATAQYRIVVSDCCGGSGNFAISVDTPLYAANGNSTAGSTVTFDNTSTPALPAFTAGTPYTIAETAFSGTFDGIVSIFDPSNNLIVSQDTGTDEVVTFYAPVSGQYTIKVAPFSTTAGDFHLTITQSLGSAGVTSDLNLLVFGTNGAYLSAKSLTSNNLANNRPVELGGSSTVSSPAGQNQLQFVIARANTPPVGATLPTRVRWSTRGNGAANIGPAEYFTYNATTTKGHASAKGCNGTAAYSVFRANVPEAFTSPGPATIFFDKNANRLPTPEVRQVPRVAAADGANSTWSAVGDSASDPDTNPNFSGTSAAAPHAAAIAALVLQAHGGVGSVTPDQMRTILQTNVFPHDLDPSFASGVASTSDGGTVTITINSDNDNNLATGMNDPNSFKVSYAGPGGIASLTFNPQGTPYTAGRPTSGTSGVQNGVPGTVSYFENDFPGMMFRPGTTIQASPFVIPARGFTLGTLTGLTAGDVAAPLNSAPFTGFSNPAPAPGTATDFWTMTVGFPNGNFTHGKAMNFTVGRGAQRSSAVTTPGTTLSALADLFGGGVMIPSGVTIPDGMTFSGTTTTGGTFSGVIRNNIGYGWSPVDGFGFIDAAAATGAGTTLLVAGGSAAPNTAGIGAVTKLTVTVTPGSSPASTGLYVSADLENIGGAPAQKFYDDGTHGDLTAGDNVFTFDATVAAGTAVGAKTFPVVVSDVQGRSGSTSIGFTVSAQTLPSGSGLATPSTVAPTDTTLLTVQTTPGAYPTSTGISVKADLSSIGGSATQSFRDDGNGGDVTAGDGIFSYSATLPFATTPGVKSLAAVIADAQGRSNSAAIALTVLATTPPSGTGAATPSSVAVTGTTTLTVTVTGGSNPASTNLSVTADLSSIGGSAAAVFLDDGVAPDVTAGDGIFSYAATLPLATAPGPRNLTATISDAEGRSGSANISLTVLTPSALSAVASASPNSGIAGAASLFSVTVTAGTDPASTGISVTADLTDFGGTATQAFTDNGGGSFSFNAVVQASATPGLHVIPVSITDDQGRNASASIAFNVPAPGALSGSGLAIPSSVGLAGSTTLLVSVTPGTDPASTGLTVVVDLSSIGGSATQTFYDDGTNGDQNAGDNIFTFVATIPSNTSIGSKLLPATIADTQLRSGSATIALDVVAGNDVIFENGFE